MRNVSIFLVALMAACAGCGQPSTAAKNSASTSAPVEKSFKPFIVYKDKGTLANHFVPSGFMPSGKCVTIDEAWKTGCFEGSSCIKIHYDVACSNADQKWAGVYWLNPANNWGKQKGGFKLEGATELTFWARGEKGGERIQEFKIGGILGDFPDSDMAIIGPVVLTNEWRKYSIDLRGKDLSYISGGFSWSTNSDMNTQDCVFYLDNIQYE